MDLHAVSCFLILLTCTGVCFGQELILPEGIDIEAGKDVVITPLRIPDPKPVLFRWLFNGSIIINAYPGGNEISPPYIGRVSVNTNTLALELRSLTERDTGPYTLIADRGLVQFTGQTSLRVWERILGTEIIGPTYVLIEGVSSATLTCMARGTIHSAEWKKDNHKLSASDSITFSDNNRSVTINPVRTADSGVYQCTLSNPVSNDTGVYNMTVNYENGESLSAGAIAGIVIGVFLGLAGIAGLIFYFMKAKEMPRKKSTENDQNGATHDAQKPDPHYVNMNEVTMSRTDTQMGHNAQPDDEPIYEN